MNQPARRRASMTMIQLVHLLTLQFLKLSPIKKLLLKCELFSSFLSR